MALPFRFKKVAVLRHLDSLSNGTPFEHSGRGWTKTEMLQLAGVLQYAVISQGPVLHPGTDIDALTDERREAICTQLLDDIRAAISVCTQLTELVRDEAYDDQFEPALKGIVWAEDGCQRVSLDGQSSIATCQPLQAGIEGT